MEIMRIIKTPNDPTAYDVINGNGTRLMRGEVLSMCTGWCRENSLKYTILVSRQPADNKENR